MENISTGLKWAIGVVLTLLIVAAGISIYMVAQGYLDRAQEQTISQSASLSEFSVYEDGATLTGSDVLEAVNRYKTRPRFSVRVATNLNTSLFYTENTGSCYTESSGVAQYSACSSTVITDYSELVDTNNLKFINPTGRFKTELYRDANGEVRLIDFTQQ